MIKSMQPKKHNKDKKRKRPFAKSDFEAVLKSATKPQILSNQRDNTDKAESLTPVISKAVVLIRSNKDNAVPGYLGFLLSTYHYPFDRKEQIPRVPTSENEME